MEALKSDYASALLQDLLGRFTSLVIDEVGEAVQFDTEEGLKKLQGKLLNAQALVDSCQLTPNNASQHWVGELTRTCYDVEDLVDNIMLGAGKASVIKKIWSYLTRGNMWSLAQKIKELQESLEDIVNGLEMNIQRCQQTQQCRSQERLKDQVRLPPGKFFGRDQDKESVFSMLLESSIWSVSVIGMGGLGKTTLAWNVHYDSRIQDCFSYTFWISVSAEFDPIKISKYILQQEGKGAPAKKRMRLECEDSFLGDQIHVLFGTLFDGKSILIVLDDVWDVEYDDWKTFRSLFPQTSSCKILTTTRNSKVASITRAATYYLPRMRDEDCGDLIMDRAIPDNNISAREHIILEEIARALAEKCKGLPLAAHVLGLYLSSKASKDDWMMLLETDICDLPVFREKIFPTFKLSNSDVASHLKRCLAYCTLLPPNYAFTKDNLVRLWMAEGFILPQGTSSLEEIGNNYFDELLMRSFFQPFQHDEHQRPTYKIHEFIHRFAEFLASNTCFRLEEGTCTSSVPWFRKTHHLSLLCHIIEPLVLKDIEKCECLRTFMLQNEHGTKIGKVPYELFEKLQRLRVLELCHTDVEKLPESIGTSLHLRYLDVSKTRIKRLPESTSDLHGLQVLKLRDCPELQKLPENTKNLTSLLHLDVDMKRLKCLTAGIGNLSCLQTLPAFIVCKKAGYRVTELKNLKFLRGTICISGLENVKDGTEAKEAMLSKKPYVKRLELEWRKYPTNGSLAMDVLASLRPDINLEELQITKFNGSSFPEWLTSPSFRLVSIHLQNSRGHDVLPSLGQLPFLKTLHIEGMRDVKYVDCRFCGEGTSGGFPSLESLKIQNMMALTSWSKLLDNSMLQLHDLTIENCPRLLLVQSLQHMRSLQKLEINFCPLLSQLPHELPASLQSLIIFKSDLVKQRCQPGGPDRYFIRRIPNVEIDFTKLFIEVQATLPSDSPLLLGSGSWQNSWTENASQSSMLAARN